MIPRLLNVQGIAGLAVALALAILLIVQRAETRHWRKQSAGFEQLYDREQTAFATTVANYRAAADQARAADHANAARVAAEQSSIDERTAHDYQSRIAAARAAAGRLRVAAATAASDRRVRPDTSLSGLSAPAAGAAQAAAQDRLSQADRLTATEQAIQLDELIKWVKAQASVAADPGASR